MSKIQPKPMTKTEIRKQVKSNEDVIKHIVLKNLKREGLKVIKDTFKLSRQRFINLIGFGPCYGMEYVVKLDNKMVGLTDLEVAGDFDILISDLKKGDAIFSKKKCNAKVRAGYEVNARGCYFVCDDWK